MFTLNCKGSLLVSDKPLVMGIINATPDSFYEASRASGVSAALKTAERMIYEGASILDIGGQSTRPNSVQVSEEEELARVVPVINAIHKAYPSTIISIDSYYPSVVKAAVEAGASIVNDISGGRFFPEILSVVASLKVPYICMHSTGDMTGLHEKNIEAPITTALIDYFKERLKACQAAGIKDVILDPGFGFGKTMEQNFTLLKELKALQIFQLPVLLGISRKTMIHRTLAITPEESLNGTTVLNTIGLMNGSAILRVHDVKEAMEAVKLTSLLK